MLGPNHNLYLLNFFLRGVGRNLLSMPAAAMAQLHRALRGAGRGPLAVPDLRGFREPRRRRIRARGVGAARIMYCRLSRPGLM